MKEYFDLIIEQIAVETSTIDIEEGDISTDEAFRMVEFIQIKLNSLREKLLACESLSTL